MGSSITPALKGTSLSPSVESGKKSGPFAPEGTPGETAVPDAAPCSPPLDPRIRRTRELLQHALSSLLETTEFEKISVQHITDEAGVNRATFYAHYPDKFALLECLVAGRFQALLAQRGVRFDGTCNQAVGGIILGVCDYLAQTPGVDCERQRQLEPHLESAVVAVVRGMLLHGLQSHPTAANTLPNTSQMLAATAAWAIFGAAKEWVRTPDRAPSEQIAAQILQLITPVLFADTAKR